MQVLVELLSIINTNFPPLSRTQETGRNKKTTTPVRACPGLAVVSPDVVSTSVVFFGRTSPTALYMTNSPRPGKTPERGRRIEKRLEAIEKNGGYKFIHGTGRYRAWIY